MTRKPDDPPFALHTSRLFPSWLAEQRLSLAFTTYQAGKVFLLGSKADGTLSIVERSFPRAMGLARDDTGFWLASLYQLWRFENFLGPGEQRDGHDAHFVPIRAHVTGDIDIHDVAVDADGQLVFVATLFNCLATTDDKNSFRPLWRPSFIDRLAAEDRCHLNGLALENGHPRFVTAVGKSNVADGWRDHRQGGGLLIDVPSGEIVVGDLSMPHSPRLHNGVLWLLNAGTGELGSVDLDTGRFQPLTFLPGFLRGLAMVGDYAVVGLSLPRENRNFTGLPLDERLKKEGVGARCGFRVVDLRTGDVVHTLDITGVVEELYDVMALPSVINPMLIGLKGDAIRTQIRPATD